VTGYVDLDAAIFRTILSIASNNCFWDLRGPLCLVVIVTVVPRVNDMINLFRGRRSRISFVGQIHLGRLVEMK
jgi:hypothetical protein